MKRPTWATVVGILGIIFGVFGILGGGQEMMMPKMLEMQKEMFSKIEEAQKKDNSASHQTVQLPTEMRSMMEETWNYPPWFGSWSIFSGISRALISALYLFAAIWMLQVKPTAIKLFYWAAGLSIFLSLLKLIVAAFATDSFMGIGMAMGSAFGGLIDLVLIVVVATADKSAFANEGKTLVEIE